MSRFRVTGTVTIEVVTWVEADSVEDVDEADISDRDVSICIHGSEFNGCEDDVDWIPVDGSALHSPTNIDVEEE